MPTKITSWAMPTDVVAINGTLRPWGLKVKGNKVYVGIVADAGNVYYPNTNNGSTNSGMPAGALMGYVYELIPSSGTWAQKLAIDFKIRPIKAGQFQYAFYNWRNWWDTPYDAITVGGTNSEYVRSQPILSDIEFDDNGAIVVGVLDRWGLQGGANQYMPIKGSGIVTCLFCCFGTGDGSTWGINYFQSPTSFLTYTSYGDIYRGVYNATTCTYAVESGTASDGGGCQGGANTEYYCEDGANTGFEGNYMQGALAFKPGSGEILSIARSPFTGHTQGVRKLSNSLGTHISEYMLMQNPAAGGVDGTSEIPGKSLGLGDIELLNTNPPLEVGNRIWEDTDNDGIQDAGEPAISGVTVYASFFELVAGKLYLLYRC
ncbi:MAG: hypothetical protein IPP48_07870 [Chitinophagaceae bacterium]|nr:hypothetical protein [Chitinophagaceae bacterium]